MVKSENVTEIEVLANEEVPSLGPSKSIEKYSDVPADKTKW